MLTDTPDGVLIKKKDVDIIQLINRIAKEPSQRPKGDMIHSIHEEYEERWKRSTKRT